VGLIVRIVVNALALLAVAYFVPGVHVTGFTGALVAAIVLGVVNAVLRPVLLLLSLPLTVLTLGLFAFVINAVLFWFVGHLNIGLAVDGFGAARAGSIVLAVVSWLLSSLVAGSQRA